MKNWIIVLFLIVILKSSIGQVVPSDCIPSNELLTEYNWDIRDLALRRIFEVNSADTALVTIPQQWQDTIAGGLAAICNAVSIPQRDSVFNLYCVHDLAFNYLTITKELIVFVDTSYAWTDAWQNMETITGNPQIDTIVTRYKLEITDFNNYSFGSMALLATDSLWNVYALIDSLEMISGVLWCEPNHLIGAAGKLIYEKTGDERFYTFWYQWNDCFDGCDNAHAWKFKVYPDCSVEYLGFDDYGFFEILPLPVPVNCNLFSATPEETFFADVHIYPNPFTEVLSVTTSMLGNIKASILNSNGIIISELAFHSSATFHFNDLPRGIYFIKLINESGQVSLYKIIRR